MISFDPFRPLYCELPKKKPINGSKVIDLKNFDKYIPAINFAPGAVIILKVTQFSDPHDGVFLSREIESGIQQFLIWIPKEINNDNLVHNRMRKKIITKEYLRFIDYHYAIFLSINKLIDGPSVDEVERTMRTRSVKGVPGFEHTDLFQSFMTKDYIDYGARGRELLVSNETLTNFWNNNNISQYFLSEDNTSSVIIEKFQQLNNLLMDFSNELRVEPEVVSSRFLNTAGLFLS